MMLVLAVIGTLAAVAWPSVMRMQADHDLSAAAEQVRQQLGQARSRAIKAGVSFQFRFEPKGRRFAVVPLDAEPEPIAMPGGAVFNSPNNAQTHAARHRFAGELSKKISFLPATSSSTALPPAQKLPDTAFQGLPNAGDLISVGWSDPLIFAADGTAMDATLILGDARGHRIDIAVRGLTGATVVGPMHREAIR